MNKKTKSILWTVVAVVVVVGGVFAARRVSSGEDASSAGPDESAARRVSVELGRLRPMVFEDRLDVAGTVEAANTALVSARIPGTVEAVFVDEGDAVVAGETRLFQTDKLSLTKAVGIAEREVDVADAAIRAGEATVRRIEADLEKARIDVERFQRLYERDRAVTANALEAQQSRWKQTTAALAEARASVDLARSRRKQAAGSLAIARKDLADSLVIAPIDGTVSERLVEPGEMAGAGMVVLRVDDLSVVEVSAWLPEACYGRVEAGRTVARLQLEGRDLGEHGVSFKSPVVDPQYRTFEVKVLLEGPPADVAPGRLVQMSVVLDRSDGVGVPLDAVLHRGGRSVIFVAEDGLARMAPVAVGLQTEGYLEVAGEALGADAAVITRGQRFCDDGVALSVVKGGR